MTCICAVGCDVYHRAFAAAFGNVYLLTRHEFEVACVNVFSVDNCLYAVTRDLFIGAYPAAVDLFAELCANGLGDGVVGIAFGMGCKVEKFVLAHFVGMYLCDLEAALGEGACFIEYDSFRIGKGFKIVAALYQYTTFAGTAYTSEKAQWY